MAKSSQGRWAAVPQSSALRLGRAVFGGRAWQLDLMLLLAVLLAATTNALVLGFHIVFVLLTVSAMFLRPWAFAVRAFVWVPIATLIVAEAIRNNETQPEELVEIPLLSTILAVVFVVSRWRAHALEDLERAQALLVERYRSELSELERELESSRKMDALGRLAGGIAHDFNNVLTAIIGNCEDLVDELDGRPASKSVSEIETAVRRASSLVDDLMSFSREHVLQSTVVDINEVLEGLAAMLQRVIGEDVTYEARLSSRPCAAFIVRNRFEQVVVNLIVNAREAMPFGGWIQVATGVVLLEEGHRFDGQLPSGRYTTMTVTDNGTGIDAEDLDRIFEPFFTTRGSGRGAGLGLSTVRDIVGEGGGIVTVDSEPGRGTRFSVYLPVPVGEIALKAPAPQTEAVSGGTETVLLIEDDEAVRARALRLLTGGGYQVLEAPDGERGLELAARSRDSIDLLVTDVVMPGIDGLGVARRLSQMSPRTRVLFVSGYAQDRIGLPSRLDGKVDILAKPFTRDELLSRARAVLDRA